MSVDGHVSRCSSQALVFPVRDVFFGFRVYVLLCQSKVYDVNDVLFLIALPANKEVFWLDISVDEVLGMHILHSRDLRNDKAKVIGEQSSSRTLLANKAVKLWQPSPSLGSAWAQLPYRKCNNRWSEPRQPLRSEPGCVLQHRAGRGTCHPLLPPATVLHSPTLFLPKLQRLILKHYPWDAAPGRKPPGMAAAFLY